MYDISEASLNRLGVLDICIMFTTLYHLFMQSISKILSRSLIFVVFYLHLHKNKHVTSVTSALTF